MKWLIGGIIVSAALAIAYYALSPLWRNTELNEASPLAQIDEPGSSPSLEEGETGGVEPVGTRLLAQGEFVPEAHDVSGRALLIDDNGQKIVRFEDFETINGPDVEIYLSTSLGDDDFVSLGDMRATSGNVNYLVPEGTDTDKYNKVLVWCQDFSVLFSYAELE